MSSIIRSAHTHHICLLMCNVEVASLESGVLDFVLHQCLDVLHFQSRLRCDRTSSMFGSSPPHDISMLKCPIFSWLKSAECWKICEALTAHECADCETGGDGAGPTACSPWICTMPWLCIELRIKSSCIYLNLMLISHAMIRTQLLTHFTNSDLRQTQERGLAKTMCNRLMRFNDSSSWAASNAS